MNVKETRSAGGVVINQSNRVLLVCQKGKSWSFPKGHIEAGEDCLSAAKREIWEESGIDELEFLKDLGSYKRYKIGLNGGDDKSESKIIRMFLFRTKQRELEPVDVKITESRWVKADDVVSMLTHRKDGIFFKSCKPPILSRKPR